MSEQDAGEHEVGEQEVGEQDGGVQSGGAQSGGATSDAGRAGRVLAYLASSLVDDPEAVAIQSEPGRNGGVRLSLRVAAGDMGRVIGRRGRIAQSIRSVVRAAAATEGRDVSVDIVD